MESIIITADDGEEIEVFILEETTISGVTYYLATDEEEGDCDAFILKLVADENDEDVFEFVEDDKELEAIAKVFAELVEDTDLV